jgi:hypothetical protein
MDGSDEASADDAGAQVVQGDHGVCQRSFLVLQFAG